MDDRLLTRDARGAVFIEKLIVLLPLLFTFFMGWELAEIGAANIVVQRASAAAGRAAMVVLPDDPVYYDDEPTHSYSGARRADVELAAGMVLSAIPQIGDDFEVDVSEPPDGFGEIDVIVRAPYQCGAVGLICRLGGTLALSARTTHAYHGAKYAYSMPSGGLGGTQQSLTSRGGGGVQGKVQALGPTTGGKPSGGPQGGATPSSPAGASPPSSSSGGMSMCELIRCDSKKGFANNVYVSGSRSTGTKVNPAKKGEGSPATSARARALQERCKSSSSRRSKKNYAALSYSCDGGVGGTIPGESIVGDPDDRRNPNANSNRHAEIALLESFRAQRSSLGSNCKVTELYSEREPCPWCRDEMLVRHGDLVDGNYKVTYGFEWNVGTERFDRTNPHECSLGFMSGCSRLKNELAYKNRGQSMRPADIESCAKQAMWEEAVRQQRELREKSNTDTKTQCAK